MKYKSRKPALLLLEDGTAFWGVSVGYEGTSGGEICFNTGMTGYQEIYTDPSYHGQIIVNTHTHIGNYGTISEEDESEYPQIKGVVINQFSDIFSRTVSSESLSDYLKRHKVVGISDIDTRLIVRHIRDKGVMNAIISSEILDEEALMKVLKKVPSMEGLELSSKACTSTAYDDGDADSALTVGVLDLGCKRSILRNLTDRGVYCRVFPAKTPVQEILDWGADAFFVSNGPGDPASMPYAVDTVRALIKTEKPVFGICLGHQIIALANGILTHKMHHGHRGINHPVKNIITGQCEITSQNHGFAVIEEQIRDSDKVEVTHINLNDDTVEGLRVVDRPVFSTQYHPEAAPGPHDSRYLFDQFIESIQTIK